MSLWPFLACPFHALSGLYCPLCGSTRAVLALLHGDVLGALRCNLLLVSVVMWVAAMAVRKLLRNRVAQGSSLADGQRVGQGFSTAGSRVVLAAVGIFTVVRNVPGVWWLCP